MDSVAEAIERFVRESNRIEGIERTTRAHIDAHWAFIDRSVITIDRLIALVSVLQPDARLRDSTLIPGVRVGDHVAPPSGPGIRNRLQMIIDSRTARNPWKQHVEYETLHPFTDGNGRSGRAIWLHRHMWETRHDPHAVERGFLHSWYYHTLARRRD